VGEACALDWRDLDLSTGTLTVRASKTNTGLREVDLPRAVVDELWTVAATSARTEPDDPVFVGTQRRRQTRGNVARRLKSAIAAANPKLEDLGIAPLSERVSPHSLRPDLCQPALRLATIRSTSPSREAGAIRASR
jgi:integrase